VQVPQQLTLQQAEEVLLANNLPIVTARYGVDAARAQRLIASLRPNPTVTLSATQFPFTQPFVNAFDNIQQYGAQVDQLIERGNKRRLRTEAADLQLKASEAQVLDAIRTQLFLLQQAYFAAVLARENVRVAEENLASINDTEALIKAQLEAGAVPEGDLIRFQANKLQFQRDLLGARLAYEHAARDVLNLLGAASSAVISVGVGGPPPPFADSPIYILGEFRTDPAGAPLADLRRYAMDNRPDVIAARRTEEAARRGLDLAYALRHRDVTVGAQYLRAGPDNTFGVTLSVPIFLFNDFRGDIDKADAQLRQAEAQTRQTTLQAVTDVEKAYTAYELNRQTLQVYTAEALAKAEESYQIAERAYREGASSLLELLDARRTLNQTRVAANQARSDYTLSLYQLEQAVGKR
jgi:cobalt-zinc-cadmium efflux system outer membrane protein